MFTAFVISLREGAEIAIILAVIMAYLRKLEQSGENKRVWFGVGAAVVLSILSGVVINALIGANNAEGFQVILEGSFKILAVILLTYMTIWMKRQSAVAASSLQVRVQKALDSGSVWALATLAFVSVIREGIETVLFIVSATEKASTLSIAGGVVLGFGLASVIGYVLYRGTYRLQLRTFFNAMSVLLMIMAAGLLAGGIHEFQEIGIIPEGIKHIWNTKAILSQASLVGGLMKAIFGYRESPNLVEVISYAAYLLGAFLLYFKPVSRRVEQD